MQTAPTKYVGAVNSLMEFYLIKKDKTMMATIVNGITKPIKVSLVELTAVAGFFGLSLCMSDIFAPFLLMCVGLRLVILYRIMCEMSIIT